MTTSLKDRGLSFLDEHRFELVVLTLYCLVLVPLLYNNVLWRDEMQAWLLARDSAGIFDLFRNLRYEGHPALWHLILMPVTRLTGDPEAMKWVQGALAVTTVAIVLLRAPFNRLEKAMFPFAYFPLIEYGIVSRSYVVGFLLVAATCAIWRQRFERPILVAALLALMANVHVFFGIISAAFVVAHFVDRWTRPAPASAQGRGRELTAAAIFIAGFALAVITAVPEQDHAFASIWKLTFVPERAVDTFNGLGAIFGNASTRFGLPALVVMLVLVWRLRSDYSAVSFFLAATIGLFTFMYIKHGGGPRHFGTFFVVFIATIWMARTKVAMSGQYLLFAVLLVNFFAMPGAVWREFTIPRSHAEDVAAYIRQNGWDRQPIIGAPDSFLSTIVSYLDIDRAYYLNGARWGSFVIWNRPRVRPYEPDAVTKALQATGTPATLIVIPKIELPDLEAAGFKKVAVFDKPRPRTGEAYVIYRREESGAAPSAPDNPN
jgi:hypothetical protein